MSSSQYDLTNLTYNVIFYSCLLIGAIGFAANFLNIAISQQSKMQKKTTMGVYNTYMSAFNILTLVFVAFLSSLRHSRIFSRTARRNSWAHLETRAKGQHPAGLEPKTSL